MRVSILEAWVPGGGRAVRGARRPSLRRWSRAAEARARETWLTLDLGARRQPFEAVVLEVEDERFFREVRTETRRDVGPRSRGTVQCRRRPTGTGWGEGVVYRLGDGGIERARAPHRRPRSGSGPAGAGAER